MKYLPVFLLLLLINTQLYAQELDAPYLYYYSEDESILVIERADGTDRRTIETNGAVTWSASGRWMATSNQVISVDGQTIIELPENANYMYWSPTEDILLTVSYFSNEGDLNGTIIYLYDVAQDKELLYLNLDYLPESPADYQLSGIRWTSNGSHASFYYYYAAHPESGFYRQKYFYTVSNSGIVEREQVNINNVFWTFPRISSRGWIIHPDINTEFVLINIMTSEEKTILFDEEVYLSNVIWNPNGQQALLFTSMITCFECGYDLWLLSTLTEDLTYISSNIDIVWQESIDAGANPDIEAVFWSPDGHYGAFTTLDNQLILFELATQELTFLEIGDMYSYQPWSWSGDSRYLLFHNETLILFEIQTQEYRITDLPHLGTSFFYTGISTDGRYSAFETWEQAPSIYDIQEARSIQLIPHSETTQQGAGNYISYYEWSENNQWIIISEVVFYAGGGNGPRAISVTNLDSTIFRELTYSYYEVHWLPEHVIPYLDYGNGT